VVLPTYADIQVLRDDRSRWLVVNGSAEELWPRVREFVLATGLLIDKENPASGVIETDWAENRARVGTGGQMLIARWLGSFYSTGMRDKYRIRLERGAQPGTTEIYLTHQGMEEVLVSVSSDTEGTRWQSRPADPELETEMLRLLMVHLGSRDEQATRQLAANGGKPEERARLTREGGDALLSLQDSLDRAWRRVGLSLDRLGFTVEDRDRSKGVYYVRYLDPDRAAGKGGWFSGWFGKSEDKPQDQFQIHLKSAEQGTDVEVLGRQGGPADPRTRDRILALLHEQLK
jgi:outer membrane protein assembly factor BamC